MGGDGETTGGGGVIETRKGRGVRIQFQACRGRGKRSSLASLLNTKRKRNRPTDRRRKGSNDSWNGLVGLEFKQTTGEGEKIPPGAVA